VTFVMQKEKKYKRLDWKRGKFIMIEREMCKAKIEVQSMYKWSGVQELKCEKPEVKWHAGVGVKCRVSKVVKLITITRVVSSRQLLTKCVLCGVARILDFIGNQFKFSTRLDVIYLYTWHFTLHLHVYIHNTWSRLL
jgi:hypothetical protein